jgi:hypothetical protein
MEHILMRNLLAAFALFVASSAAAAVGPLINGNQINPQSGIAIATFSVTGAGDTSIANSLTASSMTATGNGFKGNGSAITHITAANIDSGTLGASVIASSVAVGAVGSGQIAASVSLVTPLLGTPTSGVATNLTGTAASLTAGHVTTNANLTGPITSVGNATTIVGPVPPAAVDLSTVTTALALNATLAGPNTFTGDNTFPGGSSAFAVGASTFVVKGGSVGIGTASPAWKLDTNSLQIVNTACNTTYICNATCPAGEHVIGGGCSTVSASELLIESFPDTATDWQCYYNSSAYNIHSYAICAAFN